jgi:hypothetical protein
MAETDFVPYMAFDVRYSLSCSSDFCTLYVPAPYVSTSTKNVRGGHKNPKFPKKISKKAKKIPKSQHLPKRPKTSHRLGGTKIGPR